MLLKGIHGAHDMDKEKSYHHISSTSTCLWMTYQNNTAEPWRNCTEHLDLVEAHSLSSCVWCWVCPITGIKFNQMCLLERFSRGISYVPCWFGTLLTEVICMYYLAIVQLHKWWYMLGLEVWQGCESGGLYVLWGHWTALGYRSLVPHLCVNESGQHRFR